MINADELMTRVRDRPHRRLHVQSTGENVATAERIDEDGRLISIVDGDDTDAND